MKKKFHKIKIEIGNNITKKYNHKFKKNYIIWKLFKTLKNQFKFINKTQKFEIFKIYNKIKFYNKNIKFNK